MSPEVVSFIEYLSVVKLLNKKTILAYSADLVDMEEKLNKPAVFFDSHDILSYISKIQKPSTKNRKLSSLNSFFKYCLKEDLVLQSPRIEFSKLKQNIPSYILWKDFKQAVSLIEKKDWLAKRDYAFLLFLYGSGARVSEALSVELDDFDDGWVKFRNTKRDKERVVPLADIVFTSIKEYLNERPIDSEFLWVNYKGKKLSRISAFKIVKKYLGVYPHALRHSYATELILGGADLRVVQELLGHSSLVTTSIYTHIENKELKKTLFEYHPMAKGNQ